MKLVTVLRRESALTLAREALWRTRKRWRQAHFHKQVHLTCPVHYRPLGYYQFRPGGLDQASSEVIFRYADAVCRGEFPGFAYRPVPIGFPPQWNVDFVSGQSWPKVPAERITIMRHDGSDIKVPWELSRLQFLPVMGKAWRLSGDERYRCAAKELLIHWIEDNPVGHGVNWTIAMEAALRAISICLFLEFVLPEPTMDSWWLAVTRSLWQHLMFIEAHNEFSHFARGNHYLSNVVALFCLSSFLQGPGMKKRRHSYRTLIEKEMLLQVYKDGGDYEASTGYHLLNLQMFTTAFLVMRCQKMKLHQKFSGGLRRMYDFLAVLADCCGKVPHIGDCDDGRVELLSDDLEQMGIMNCDDRHSLTISGLLGLGEALFDETYNGNNKEAVWYGLHSTHTRDSSFGSNARRSVVFPDSGIAIGRHGALEVMFLAMPNGMKGKGTHTHNDKLSVLVSFNGKPLFIDCGTGCYTRNANTRNRFRSTAAHNTILVDGEEQNRFSTSEDAVFIINNDAHVTSIEVKEADGFLSVSASHDGYARRGVTHKRSVKLRPAAILTIEDYLAGAGNHTFEMRFHLHCRWHVEVLQGKGKEIKCRLKDGVSTLELTCEAAIDLEVSCTTGKVSPAYGLITNGKVIVVHGSFEVALPLLSRLIPVA